MQRDQFTVDNFTNLNINFNYEDERLTYTRHRTTLTNEHLKELELKFSEDSRPSNQVRSDLAKKLNLTERTVQIWFQNRRTKARAQGELPPANKNKRKTKLIRSVPKGRCSDTSSSISPTVSGTIEDNSINYNPTFSNQIDYSNYLFTYNPYLLNNPYQLPNFTIPNSIDSTTSPPSLLDNQFVLTNDYLQVPNYFLNLNQNELYLPNFTNENVSNNNCNTTTTTINQYYR